MYAISSEPHTLASQAQSEWESSLIHVGDPHHEILEDCRKRGWIDLIISNWDPKLLQKDLHWVSHPKGFFQPGVLVIGKDGTILYRWQQDSLSKRNAGGATTRPTAEYVWLRLDEALRSPTNEDANFDSQPETDGDAWPWPVSVALLVANGWFIRPKILAPPSKLRAKALAAVLRILLFVGLWVAAFYYLPGWLASGLLIGWIAWVIPEIRRMYRSFLEPMT